VYFINPLHIIERSHGFERNGFKTKTNKKSSGMSQSLCTVYIRCTQTIIPHFATCGAQNNERHVPATYVSENMALWHLPLSRLSKDISHVEEN